MRITVQKIAVIRFKIQLNLKTSPKMSKIVSKFCQKIINDSNNAKTSYVQLYIII